MEAGQGLWNLYAIMCYLERKGSTDPATLQLTGLGLQCCRSIAEYMSVGLPTDSDLQAYFDYFKQEAERQPDRAKPAAKASKEEVQHALALCESIKQALDKLAGIMEAEEFVDSVGTKVVSMQEWISSKRHVTAKMVSALENIKGGTDKWLRRNRSLDAMGYVGDHDDDRFDHSDIPF